MSFDFIASHYPVTPGVYLMKEARGHILYVGKAKNLRSRLTSYFRAQQGLSAKTRALVGHIDSIDTLSTTTEKEALLLEASLIKKHRPRYNIVLRDDKSYVLFRLSKGGDYPRLTMTRKVLRDGSVYYGPFTSGHAARQTWKLLNRAFRLRKCRDAQLKNRVRPCLYHHIGQCLAPCVNEVSSEEYAGLVRQVELFLAGRTGELVRSLRREMQEASDGLEFERAAFLRDQVRAIETTIERQVAILKSATDMDALAVSATDKGLALGLLFIRQGRLLGKKTFFWSGLVLEEGPETAAAFLGQFYWKNRFIPERILMPWLPEDSEFLAEMLTERRGSSVYLATPKTFAEKHLLDMARTNALQDARMQEQKPPLADALSRALHIAHPVRTIECVDVSHLAGKGMRAGMVVFEEELPLRESYRSYTFPELEGTADDYAALAAWTRRRIESGPPWPDLVLIDGGRGQLSAVGQALETVFPKHPFSIAAIAKAEKYQQDSDGLVVTQKGQKERKGPDRRAGALGDRIFLPKRKNPLPIKPGSPVLLFLQRVRNAAHTFVIGRQRRSRTGTMLQSELASVPDVGPKTARLLWDAFGSLGSIQKATVQQLQAVSGIGPKRARAVHSALATLAVKADRE